MDDGKTGLHYLWKFLYEPYVQVQTGREGQDVGMELVTLPEAAPEP